MGLLRPRRVGIVGMAARTAVVAGTATAVAGRVSRHQQEKYAAQTDVQQQAAPQPAPEAAPPAAPAEGGGDDIVAQLEQLSQLHNSGVLTDEQFEAAKAKLLG
ncbi:MAG TPA: SHOCT domain-containing protein [Acidimicrobiia bacterium]|nr:SHOCT domain-containing protein [Acidimicrobiia bacterium]